MKWLSLDSSTANKESPVSSLNPQPFRDVRGIGTWSLREPDETKISSLPVTVLPGVRVINVSSLGQRRRSVAPVPRLCRPWHSRPRTRSQRREMASGAQT